MAIAKAQVVSGCAVSKITLSAAATFDITGGGFVNINTGTGNGDMSVAADTVISGYADFAAVGSDDSNVSSNVLTVPSSPGDKYTFDFYHDPIVRMPVASGQTVAKTYGGLLCDLDVTTSKQTVDIAAGTGNALLQILPISQEDIDTNSVRVRINPAKFGR